MRVLYVFEDMAQRRTLSRAFLGHCGMKPVKPWDLLNKDNWTFEEVQAKRIEICEECPAFNKLRQCTYCHCFMDAKTWLEKAYCPVRKW